MNNKLPFPLPLMIIYSSKNIMKFSLVHASNTEEQATDEDV